MCCSQPFLRMVLPILGDFNIHLDKPQAADFHTLLASFDLKRVLTTPTHKSGNQLDLIYTRHCSTEHVLVFSCPKNLIFLYVTKTAVLVFKNCSITFLKTAVFFCKGLLSKEKVSTTLRKSVLLFFYSLFINVHLIV